MSARSFPTSPVNHAVLAAWADGRSVQQISEEVGLTSAAVHGHIWRARSRGNPLVTSRDANEPSATRLNQAAITNLFLSGWLAGEIAMQLGYKVSSVRGVINRRQRAGMLPYRVSQAFECDHAFWVRNAAVRGVAPSALRSRVLQICEQGLLGAILDDGVEVTR